MVWCCPTTAKWYMELSLSPSPSSDDDLDAEWNLQWPFFLAPSSYFLIVSSMTSSFMIVVLKFDQPTMTLTVWCLGDLHNMPRMVCHTWLKQWTHLFLQQEFTHKSGGVCILGIVNTCVIMTTITASKFRFVHQTSSHQFSLSSYRYPCFLSLKSLPPFTFQEGSPFHFCFRHHT